MYRFPMMTPPVGLRTSRRGFLLGAAAVAGGFAVGFRSVPGHAQESAVAPDPNPFEAYVTITDDDRVTVISSQFDMGQGSYHGLATLVVEELGARWDQVDVVGGSGNEQAATFTMVHCADTNDEAFADAAESFPWYVRTAVRHIASLADWMSELGSYGYAGQLKTVVEFGGLDGLSFDFLRESGSAVVGDPARCIEIARRYEAAGCDLLLCLVQPYAIPHAKVMRSIELLGQNVIPAFR